MLTIPDLLKILKTKVKINKYLLYYRMGHKNGNFATKNQTSTNKIILYIKLLKVLKIGKDYLIKLKLAKSIMYKSRLRNGSKS